MTYKTAQALRQALKARLDRIAHQTGLDMPTLQRRLVIQQFLARLLRVVDHGWALTGGAALDWRLAQRQDFQRRVTVDLDVLYRATEEVIRAALSAAAQVDLADGLRYIVVPARGTDGERGSYRFHLTAYIGTVPYLKAKVDVGVVDPLEWEPDFLPAPLSIPELGIGGFTIPGLPIPHTIAEKVHAITRTVDGLERSRMAKDMADLALIARTERFAASAVRAALDAVFLAYGTHAMPAAMPLIADRWAGDYAEIAKELGLPPDSTVGHSLVSACLDPVLTGQARGMWDPDSQRWQE
jgi:hypothetical protein